MRIKMKSSKRLFKKEREVAAKIALKPGCRKLRLFALMVQRSEIKTQTDFLGY